MAFTKGKDKIFILRNLIINLENAEVGIGKPWMKSWSMKVSINGYGYDAVWYMFSQA